MMSTHLDALPCDAFRGCFFYFFIFFYFLPFHALLVIAHVGIVVGEFFKTTQIVSRLLYRFGCCACSTVLTAKLVILSLFFCSLF